MSTLVHRIYILLMTATGFVLFVLLAYWGYSYYATGIEYRPFHADHTMLKPSGPMGHGLGIIGTLLILIGVFSYIGRKKRKFLPKVGALKYWLEFHIFLCSIGPLMILFHTAFKFGGIVSISFWSMVAVVLSGVIGRFIYIQIPRTIQGRELSLTEIKDMRDTLSREIREKYNLSEEVYNQLIEATQRKFEYADAPWLTRIFKRGAYNRSIRSRVKKSLQQTSLSTRDQKGILKLVNNEITINARIGRLQTMQTLFKYWHVAHLPFALIMLVIMVIHVAITIAFGYRWIF